MMTEPQEFSLLNLDRNSEVTFQNDYMPDPFFKQFRFDVSQTVVKEKRQVMSWPVLFGELGGLYEFLATISVFFIGCFQAKAFLVN